MSNKFDWGLTLLWSFHTQLFHQGSTLVLAHTRTEKTLTWVGFEPTTVRLDQRCSTDWATRPEREQGSVEQRWSNPTVVGSNPTQVRFFSVLVWANTRVDPWWNNWIWKLHSSVRPHSNLISFASLTEAKRPFFVGCGKWMELPREK